MTMRERFEQQVVGLGNQVDKDHNGMYCNMLIRWRWYGFKSALRLMWPPRPTDAQLDATGVRIVGDEPEMVMPGEKWPDVSVYPWREGLKNGTDVPVFVWLVEKINQCETCKYLDTYGDCKSPKPCAGYRERKEGGK